MNIFVSIWDFIKNLKKLYHSNPPQYENKFLLEVGLLFLIAFVSLMAIFGGFDNDRIVYSLLAIYAIVLCLVTGIFLIYSSGYFFGYEKYSIKKFRLRTLGFGVIILAFILTYFFPIAILWLFSSVLFRKSKKIENIEGVLILFSSDLLVMLIYLVVEQSFGLTMCIAKYVSDWGNLKWGTVYIFMDLFIVEIAIMLINNLFLKIHIINQKKLEFNNLGESQGLDTEIVDAVMADSNISTDCFSLEYFPSDYEYDINYIKYTAYKINLLLVIIFFFLTTISNDDSVVTIYPHISNVLTCFTLIILFLDKNKEWTKY